MAQHINLYEPPKRAGGDQAGLQAAFVASGIITLATLGVYVAQWRQFDALRAELPRVEAEMQRIQRVIAKVPSPNASKAEALGVEEREVTALETIAARLTSGAVGRAGGFTESLRAFGRTATDGVWLTALRVDNGAANLTIEGRALDASRVPALLAALRAEPYFTGASFGAIEIKAGEEVAALSPLAAAGAPLRFRITSSSGSAEGRPESDAREAAAAMAEAIRARHARRDAAATTPRDAEALVRPVPPSVSNPARAATSRPATPETGR